jgi:hypothetical protein
MAAAEVERRRGDGPQIDLETVFENGRRLSEENLLNVVCRGGIHNPNNRIQGALISVSNKDCCRTQGLVERVKI